MIKYDIKIDNSRDSLFTDFGSAVLKDRYLINGETKQELFKRVALAYGDNQEHAQRIYDYISKMWFMPATPILANGGTNRGLPISCFLNEMQDSLDSIAETWNENVYLASSGGGIGTHIGNIRSINEDINGKGQTSGVIPFIKVVDSMTLAISQGSLRRGSAAVYMQDNHPEIEEFIDIRRPTGGDTNRRCLNIHHGICISDSFMNAVSEGKPWNLISPSSGKITNTINARDLWIKILSTRIETGEPYLLFTDTVNKNLPEVYKAHNFKVKTSNLCVAPETLILTTNGWQEIQNCENQKTTIWNGFEWSEVTPRKTGENQKLIRVETDYMDKDGGGYIDCTEYHKWYVKRWYGVKCVRTNKLKVGDKIIEHELPYMDTNRKPFMDSLVSLRDDITITNIKDEGRISDTYCFTEPKRNMAVFNGILTGNCSEIMLQTGLDQHKKERTAVCCLSSLNLEYYEAWKNDEMFIEDIARFLDNVLEDFIKRAPNAMERAKYSSIRERSIGIGVMGFHSFLQSKMTPIEGVAAKSWNNAIFKHIKERCDIANEKLANEKEACPDAIELGINNRFSNMLAIAPTASISIIAGNSSPGIEPYSANCYTHKTLSGSFIVKNKMLAKLLEEKSQNTDSVWSSIALNEGSVQHLNFLTPEEKEVFKTAMEINQMWLIDHAADRQKYICQAQSLNVFFASDVEKKVLHDIHFSAWKKGVKSLYYCRSSSIQRAEKSDDKFLKNQQKENEVEISNQNQYDECLACQ
jgi:ribonucleotide reductase alpha subunit